MEVVSMNLPDDFVFSQSALQDFAECARRFELRYINEIQWPALETQSALEFEATMQKGKEFHHLLHQHALGVPAESLEKTINDDSLRLWWQHYLDWQQENLPAERHPEITLTAALNDQLLMAKYDLIACKPDGEFLIVDWKTGKFPKSPGRLADRMQSLIYPFVLERAGSWLNGGKPIPPERIRMIYWFAEDGRAVEFPLTAEKLGAIESRLASLLDEIRNRTEFPLTQNERLCRFCVYRSLCERGVEAGELSELNAESDPSEAISLDLDALEEIAF